MVARFIRMLRVLVPLIAICSSAAALRAQTNYDTAPQSQTGEQIYGSYFGSNIDTVGLYNGNLTLSIPVFSLPGRELPYGITLVYNAQKWQSDSCSGYPCGLYTGGWQKTNVFGSDPSFFATYDHCGPDGFTPVYEMDVYWIDGQWCETSLQNDGEWNRRDLRERLPVSATTGMGQLDVEHPRFGRFDVLDGEL